MGVHVWPGGFSDGLISVVSTCVYCGRRTRGLTCAAHTDLRRLDPHYSLGKQSRQHPSKGNAAAGSNRKGL